MNNEFRDRNKLLEELERSRERLIELEIREIERREVDRALLENHWTLSSLVNGLLGIAYRRRIDSSWTMEFVSDGCQELTGYEAGDLVLNKFVPYVQLVHPDDRETAANEIRQALKGDKPYNLTYRIKTASGAEKWIWEQGRGYYLTDENTSVTEGFISDVTAQKNFEDELIESAAYDSLTGLLNRGHLLKLLKSELHASKRHGHPLSICFCDLDDFKMINDSFGHVMGDQVLSTFGLLIKEELRLEDISGRFGGDEFCMVLPYTPAAKALTGIERIRERLTRQNFNANGKGSFKATATFGLVDFTAADLDETAVLDYADQALYKAKQLGKNQIYVPKDLD